MNYFIQKSERKKRGWMYDEWMGGWMDRWISVLAGKYVPSTAH